MTSVNFINTRLAQLVSKFPFIRARYKNDQVYDAHLVEITPSFIYNIDKDFKQEEERTIFDFIEKFPFENIVFLAEDDEYKIQSFDSQYLGNQYSQNSGLVTVNYTFELDKKYQKELTNTLLPYLESVDDPNWDYIKAPILSESHSIVYNNILIELSDKQVLNDIAVDDLIEEVTNYNNIAGDNNYALAA